MSPGRPAQLPLNAVLDEPPSPVQDGAQAPSLWRVQRQYISSKVWKSRECARAIMCYLGTAFNDEVFHLVVETYRAWQLVFYCGLSPDEALPLVSVCSTYCLALRDSATSEVPLHHPPFGYNGCHGCWKRLNDIQKLRTWIPFWVATGQVTITDIGGNCGGGGSAAVDDGAATGNGP